MPSKERRERREQKRAVDAKLGDGEIEGEGEGTEKLGIREKVSGDGGGKAPERSMMSNDIMVPMLQGTASKC